MTHPDPEIRAQFDKDRALVRARTRKGKPMAGVNWFGKLHPTIQALIVLGTAFTAGGAAMGVVYQFRGLPEVAAQNHRMLDSLYSHERIIDRMTNLERSDMAQNGDLRLIRMRMDSLLRVSCLTLAELRSKGWDDCVR